MNQRLAIAPGAVQLAGVNALSVGFCAKLIAFQYKLLVIPMVNLTPLLSIAHADEFLGKQ